MEDAKKKLTCVCDWFREFCSALLNVQLIANDVLFNGFSVQPSSKRSGGKGVKFKAFWINYIVH